MSSAYICRVCLSNSHVKIIANTHLQSVFEKLTSNQLITEDRRPESVCNICYLLLQKCCNFVEVSQKTEEFLTQLFHDGIELTAENLAKTAIHTPNHLSMSNITFVSVPKDNGENLKKVTIKIEPEERKFVENESETCSSATKPGKKGKKTRLVNLFNDPFTKL